MLSLAARPNACLVRERASSSSCRSAAARSSPPRADTLRRRAAAQCAPPVRSFVVAAAPAKPEPHRTAAQARPAADGITLLVRRASAGLLGGLAATAVLLQPFSAGAAEYEYGGKVRGGEWVPGRVGLGNRREERVTRRGPDGARVVCVMSTTAGGCSRALEPMPCLPPPRPLLFRVHGLRCSPPASAQELFSPMAYVGRWYEVASLKRGFAGEGQQDCHCTQVNVFFVSHHRIIHPSVGSLPSPICFLPSPCRASMSLWSRRKVPSSCKSTRSACMAAQAGA